MTVRRTLAVAIVLIAAAGAGWYFWSRRVVTTASERLLPDSAVALLEVTEFGRTRANLDGSTLTRALRQAHSPGDPGRFAIRAIARRLRLDPVASEQLAGLIAQDVAVAWIPDPSGIQPALVANAGARGAEAKALALRAAPPAGGTVEDSRYRDVPFSVKGGQSAVAQFDAMIVIASSVTAMRAIIDARGSKATLAANSRLRAAKRLLGFRRGLLAYADLSGTRRFGPELINQLAAVSGAQAVAYTSAMSGGGFEDRMALLIDSAKPPAVFRAWRDMPPRSFSLDAAEPAAVNASLDLLLPPPTQLWDALQADVAARLPNDEAGRATQAVAVAEEMLHMKLRDDLLAALGDEVSVGADLSALALLLHRRDAGAATPGHAVLVARLRDRHKWEAAFDRLAALLGQTLERHPYRRAEIATLGPPESARLAIGFDDDLLVAAASRPMTEEAVDARQAGGLTARADIRAILGRVPARGHARAIISGPALARLVLQKFGPADGDPKPVADSLGAAAVIIRVTREAIVADIRAPVSLALVVPFEAPEEPLIPLPPR